MVFGFLKTRRRRRLREQPVPRAWRAIADRNLPIFRRLSRGDQTELWRTGGTLPMRWDPDSVREGAEHRMVLVPAGAPPS